MNLPKVDNTSKKGSVSTSTSFFPSFDPLKYANAKINAAKDSANAAITNQIISVKGSANAATKEAKNGLFSVGEKMKKSFDSTNKDLKNASSSAFSSAKDTFKTNYQKWLKYGVFFFLVAYVGIIVVGLFGLPPEILHNTFSFLTGILDYFRLDYTSIGKPPQSDNLVEEGKGIQVNYKKK